MAAVSKRVKELALSHGVVAAHCWAPQNESTDIRSCVAIGGVVYFANVPDRDLGRQEFPQHRFRPPPGATELILVRHGESAPASFDRPEPLIDGRADPPLAAEGRLEAEQVARRLRSESIAAIYVSNLRRAAETAVPLAVALDLRPMVEPRLTEVHLGDWEGAAFRKHFAEQHPLAVKAVQEQRWDVLPGAENDQAFQTRVRDAIERIAASHTDERVAVVTHGGVIGTVVSLATGALPLAFVGSDNGSLTQVVVTEERWLVRSFNDTAHLDA